MFTVLIRRERKSGWDEKRVREVDLLKEIVYTTQLMLAFFSSNLDCNLFGRFFWYPPIPFTKSSNFSFANTLIYGERMNAWTKKIKLNEFKLVKARTFYTYVHTINQTNNINKKQHWHIYCHSNQIASICLPFTRNLFNIK